MTVAELRGLRLTDLLTLLHRMGLSIEGIEEKSQALTRLMETAVEVEIDD
jgi:hypothetical protein